ncbi:MAG: hypothetical protein L0Z73_14280 [Gammaproteobacteria bacterium]|nr:hypothetical protein [Gammaproteobacteria bacterium]
MIKEAGIIDGVTIVSSRHTTTALFITNMRYQRIRATAVTGYQGIFSTRGACEQGVFA